MPITIETAQSIRTERDRLALRVQELEAQLTAAGQERLLAEVARLLGELDRKERELSMVLLSRPLTITLQQVEREHNAARTEVECLTAQLAHLTESAGDDSCADLARRCNAAEAEVARLKTRVAELEFVVRCPECGGDGEQTFNVVRHGTEHDTRTVECPACKGTGICRDMITELTRLRAERAAEQAVVEAAEAFVKVAPMPLNGRRGIWAPERHALDEAVDALRAAREADHGGKAGR